MLEKTKVERAEQDLEQLVTERAEDEPNHATKQDARLRAEQRRREERRAKRNRLLWCEHYLQLAEHHTRLAEENKAKADALIPPPGL